jgi:hypothetical protein
MRRLMICTGPVAVWGKDKCIQGFGEETRGKETAWKT